MVGAPPPVSPPARDPPSASHPGWPRSPFRGAKDEEGGHSDDVSAADSWSIRSDYGSTLDGEDTRAIDVLEAVPDHAQKGDHADAPSASGEDATEDEGSELGLQSHWDAAYAEELATFRSIGEPGEIWFGEDVQETMADFTARLSAACAEGTFRGAGSLDPAAEAAAGAAADWSLLDVGCGNGLLLHALAHRGFRRLSGTDYSEAGVQLARDLLARALIGGDGAAAVGSDYAAALRDAELIVDDVLDSQLHTPFDLVVDKGTLDAVGLHPSAGREHRRQYQQTIARLVRPGGLLVITSCNSTQQELVAEFCGPQARESDPSGATGGDQGKGSSSEEQGNGTEEQRNGNGEAAFEFLDHVRTYPVFHFGGSSGTRVCTVAFRRKGPH